MHKHTALVLLGFIMTVVGLAYEPEGALELVFMALYTIGSFMAGMSLRALDHKAHAEGEMLKDTNAWLYTAGFFRFLYFAGVFLLYCIQKLPENAKRRWKRWVSRVR